MLCKPRPISQPKQMKRGRIGTQGPGFEVTLHLQTAQKSFVYHSIPELRNHTRIAIRGGQLTFPRFARVGRRRLTS